MPAVPVILPARLDELLLRIQQPRAFPVPVLGVSAACMASDHRMQTWIEGRYANRDLRLRKCAACEGVEVRDVSFDVIAGLPRGRLAPRRLDALLGWYAGRRPRGREYLGSLGSRRA